MEKFPMRNSEQSEEPVGGAKRMEGEKIAEKTASPEVMRKYLYNFGYTTPGRPKGTDLEEALEVFIIADSSEKALEWGKHLSDTYINRLRQETEDRGVYKGAEWVESEEELREGESPTDYSHIPIIRYGEAVDFREVFKERAKR